MNIDAFSILLDQASIAAREFASTMVTNALPSSSRYCVYLNQSFDENPLAHDEKVFPKDTDNSKEPVEPLTSEQIIAILWRDGFIPEWIDISAEHADPSYTYFHLLCSGRFSCNDSRLYYISSKLAPFGIKSPRLPPHWSPKQGRFTFKSQI